MTNISTSELDFSIDLFEAFLQRKTNNIFIAVKRNKRNYTIALSIYKFCSAYNTNILEYYNFMFRHYFRKAPHVYFNMLLSKKAKKAFASKHHTTVPPIEYKTKVDVEKHNKVIKDKIKYTGDPKELDSLLRNAGFLL